MSDSQRQAAAKVAGNRKSSRREILEEKRTSRENDSNSKDARKKSRECGNESTKEKEETNLHKKTATRYQATRNPKNEPSW